MEKELDFVVDTGRPRQSRDMVVEQMTIRGFIIDTKVKYRSSFKKERIMNFLLKGWGLDKLKPHTVIESGRRSRVDREAKRIPKVEKRFYERHLEYLKQRITTGEQYPVIETSEIGKHSEQLRKTPTYTSFPTVHTITGAFGTSKYTAYKILREIKKRLKLHQIDLRKRSKRGDFLVKLQRQMRQDHVTQLSLRRFFNPNRLKRMEKRAKRIQRGH